MKRLGFLAALSMLTMLILAPAALAQSRGPSGADGTYNCSDFDTQQQAQAYFEANNPQADPDGLDADGDLVACESLPSGAAEDGTMMGGSSVDPFEEAIDDSSGTAGGGGFGTAATGNGDIEDLDCVDFATQEAAQANLNANPSDPNNLDADDDGIACERTIDAADAVQFEDGTGFSITGPPATGGDTGGDVAETPVTTDGTQMQEMPDTGGPGLLAPLAVLLIGSGVLGLAWTRQRNS